MDFEIFVVWYAFEDRPYAVRNVVCDSEQFTEIFELLRPEVINLERSLKRTSEPYILTQPINSLIILIRLLGFVGVVEVMRSIRISDEVWQEIAKRGKFGETEDDVLRRVFEVRLNGPSQDGGVLQPNNRTSVRGDLATNKMHAKVYHEKDGVYLKVRFHGSGEEQNFDLPEDRSDKRAIRSALERALGFGEQNGASKGQLFAIRKALTDADYHLTK